MKLLGEKKIAYKIIRKKILTGNRNVPVLLNVGANLFHVEAV
jgi:hypothetical protein